MIEAYIDNLEDLKDFLRAAREAEGLTIMQAAAESGLNNQTIRNYENIPKRDVYMAQLLQLLRTYGYTLHIEPKED